MSLKHFPSHICLVLLISMGLVPSLGYTQAHIVLNDISYPGKAFNHESHILDSHPGFKPISMRHEFHADAMEFAIESQAFAGRVLMDKKTNYNLAPRVYAFSASRHEQDPFRELEYRGSTSAGIGWHLLNDGINRLDLDIGAGSSAYKLQASNDTERYSIRRLGVRFTSQPSPTWQFHQDLVIESSRTSTSSESRTTWNLAMNSKLALQLLFSVRKNSGLPPDPLSMDRHTSINLAYTF